MLNVTSNLYIAGATTRIKMPKKTEKAELEWMSHKDTILGLYVDEKKPLPYIIRFMATQGFERT